MWNATWTGIPNEAKQWFDGPKPLGSYFVWDGSGWLTAEAMELAGQLPFVLRTKKDKPRWAELQQVCVKPIFLGIAGRCGMVHGLQFLLEPSEWVARMSGFTCMQIGLAIVPRGGLIAGVLAVCS